MNKNKLLNKKRNSIKAMHLFVTHNLIVTEVYKAFERASSIMANASVCHADHPSSIPGSSTVTINNINMEMIK